MKCRLMHKDIAVASLEFDEVTGVFSDVYELISFAHLPVGVSAQNGVINRRELHSWWIGRTIPLSRSGLKEALKILGASTPYEMLDKCLGLSLSDHYWVLPDGADINWNDVNFFENDFSEDIGNILIGIKNDTDNTNYMSPDISSDGWLRKKWKISSGERVLLKGGSGSYWQEPFNEVLATSVMRRLGITGVEYTLEFIDKKPYSMCKNFLTSETELIGAQSVMKLKKKANNKSLYEHYIECCKENGINNIEHVMNQMLTLDYIIINEDRHLNNFGLIRNASTLNYECAAPVYDNGTSLWLNTSTQNITAGAREIESKPFKTNHAEQIKLVTNFDWLCFENLKGIDEEFAEILELSKTMDDNRKDILCCALKMRIDMLKRIVDKSIK